MAILEVLTYPDPRLKQISKPVEKFDESLSKFVNDLEETMRAFPGCVGIASPQVGRLERIVIIDVSSKPKIPNHGFLVLVNPEITAFDGSIVGREGCLSVPNYTGNVARADKITVEAFDPLGNRSTCLLEGFEARVVQHEVDHLDGLLFPDRLVSGRRSLFPRKVYNKPSQVK